jgi:hypothetical protein
VFERVGLQPVLSRRVHLDGNQVLGAALIALNEFEYRVAAMATMHMPLQRHSAEGPARIVEFAALASRAVPVRARPQAAQRAMKKMRAQWQEGLAVGIACEGAEIEER